jgi:hypothetical protein
LLTDGLIALASLAGQTVVKAASTDTWEAAKRGMARLLGRSDPKQERLAERRLEESREQLAQLAAADDWEQVRATLAAQWATRFADLLEEHPIVETDLQTLVQEIQAQLPSGMVSAADHALASGRDVHIIASSGGSAVGVIHGNVASPNPTLRGTAKR